MKCFQAADTNTLPNYSQAAADPPNTQVLGSIPPAPPSYPRRGAAPLPTAGPSASCTGLLQGCFLLGKLLHLASCRALQCSPSTCTPAHRGDELQHRGQVVGLGSALPAAAQAAQHGSELTTQLSETLGKSRGSTSLQHYASIPRVNSFFGAQFIVWGSCPQPPGDSSAASHSSKCVLRLSGRAAAVRQDLHWFNPPHTQAAREIRDAKLTVQHLSPTATQQNLSPHTDGEAGREGWQH